LPAICQYGRRFAPIYNLGKFMNQIATVGVDLAKAVIVVCAADREGRTLFFEQLSFSGFAQWVRWLRLAFRSSQIQAENLFLRRQLALYMELGATPRRLDAATRIALTLLSRLFNWRDALVVVS
jgi:hypothetical protein